jgi:UDP-N-acetylglucosamine--N-acetylmuramyl-(pentapeptide) pyrophosphoryl-undecaprenol N-acetylglucosamine transferase
LRPDVAIGFGGYPTVPPILAAAKAGVPTIIHDQNAVLGRANRFLSGRVKTIATSIPGVGGAYRGKIVETGNPVRPAVRDAAKAAYPVRAAADPFRLLVVGGSQGARVHYDVVPAAQAALPGAARSKVRVVQQCRPEDIGRVREAYMAAGVAAELAPFFNDLPKRMSDSHLVICRSGASTCTELAVIGRPAIMVPLPGALDQDQKANATVLANAGAGWLIEQRDMTAARLADEVARAIDDPRRLVAAAAAARAVARPDAVERLADLVEQVASGQLVRTDTGVPA